ILREVAAVHSDRPVVVVDEFDRMVDERERSLFSDLVKQLGDKKINVTFFFTGVAPTLANVVFNLHPKFGKGVDRDVPACRPVQLFKLNRRGCGLKVAASSWWANKRHLGR